MISMVMAYHNRLHHLVNTVYSLAEYHPEDFELIIVDDASGPGHTLEDIGLFIDYPIKVVRIEPEDKWWTNPCIPYNRGFAEASGDIVIIQNPECLHVGNVVEDVRNRAKSGKYLVYGCYATTKEQFKRINAYELTDLNEEAMRIVSPLNNRKAKDSKGGAWYQHSVHRPELLHFCSAITKKDLDTLGGFDERFANGIGKDDREFVLRIKRLGMEIEQIDNPFVLHQYHDPTVYDPSLTKINRDLFQIVKREKIVRAN